MADTQSVLDRMAGDILARKRTAGAKLTPVGLERQDDPSMRQAGVEPVSPFPAYVPGAVFPNDAPVQEIVAAIREIRRRLADIDESLFAVEAAVIGEDAARANALATFSSAQKPPVVDMAKAKERLADAKAAIAGRLEGKEQKEATFPPKDDGWRCSIHGTFIDAVTRKGRAARRCPECDQWEPAS